MTDTPTWAKGQTCPGCGKPVRLSKREGWFVFRPKERKAQVWHMACREKARKKDAE